MALTWLTYNGSTVGLASHAGYGLGFDSTPQPSPRPIAGNGIVRFRFENTAIDVATLNSIKYGSGYWTPVIDIDTGDPIPGLWDFTYDRSKSYFSDNFPNGIMYATVGNAELIDIKDTISSPTYNTYWDHAFDADTALTKANVTQLTLSQASTNTIYMFANCTHLLEAHIECGAAKTERIFYGCNNLSTLYISAQKGLSPNPFDGCTSLRELTIETTDASSGWFFGNDNNATLSPCENSIQEITLIHPDTATMTLVGGSASGDEQFLFDGCAYLRHVIYVKRITDHSSSRYGELDADRMPITSRGDIQCMFRGCASLEAIPPFVLRTAPSNVNYMFYECRKVRSGISAAYDVLSAANPGQHRQTFTNCGVDTQQGRDELQTVPTSWGGLAIG